MSVVRSTREPSLIHRKGPLTLQVADRVGQGEDDSLGELRHVRRVPSLLSVCNLLGVEVLSVGRSVDEVEINVNPFDSDSVA